VVKKITNESEDQPSEGDDHGVLDDAGLDTTAIGIMSPHTAQVRVVLPQVLEEPDDEVIDDELDPGDLRNGEIVIELPAEQLQQAVDAVAEAEEAGEEPALTGEIVDDVVDAVRDRLAERDAALADDEVIDVVVVPDTATDPGDEPADAADPEDEHEEPAEFADEAADGAEPLDDGADDAPAVTGTPESADDEFVEDEPTAEPADAEAADDAPAADEEAQGPAVDAWRAAAAELVAEHGGGRLAAAPAGGPDEPEADTVAPSASGAPGRSEQEADGSADATDAQRATSYARRWAEESAAARAASTELQARPGAPLDTPTTGALTMTARRLEDLGKNAERESSDLLTADRVLNPHRVARPAPEGGWSEFVYGLTGGRVNLGDGRKARARKALEARVAAPLSGQTRFVPVLSRKGGVGKTTVTTLLGMALADGRDDRVIAIDANPDRGTLADRIAKRTDRTVRDLVHRAGEIRGFNDISRFVARDETRLDVLASDPAPRVAEAFGEDDYHAVAEVAEHYYSLVLTDTGTGIIHSVMGATLAHADQLVIVSGLNLDEVRLASETITWLESHGYEDLARNAVVVLNQQSQGAPMVRVSELEVHFGSRVRSVVHLPYDPALGTGSAIVYRDLQPATRAAARDLAARVVDGLREVHTA
jgi:MinD-like ATPase involved in chromosome partitioning or flagellar assembly